MTKASNICVGYRACVSTLLALMALATASSVNAQGTPIGGCNGVGEENVCITFTPVNSAYWDVHVGIDIPMSRAYAELILQCPGGSPFYVELWGDDDSSPRTVLPISPTWPQAWDGGISSEFDLRVHARVLDEDPNQEDELYARIFLLDCNARDPRRPYSSGVVRHNFQQ